MDGGQRAGHGVDARGVPRTCAGGQQGPEGGRRETHRGRRHGEGGPLADAAEGERQRRLPVDGEERGPAEQRGAGTHRGRASGGQPHCRTAGQRAGDGHEKRDRRGVDGDTARLHGRQTVGVAQERRTAEGAVRTGIRQKEGRDTDGRRRSVLAGGEREAQEGAGRTVCRPAGHADPRRGGTGGRRGGHEGRPDEGVRETQRGPDEPHQGPQRPRAGQDAAGTALRHAVGERIRCE